MADDDGVVPDCINCALVTASTEGAVTQCGVHRGITQEPLPSPHPLDRMLGSLGFEGNPFAGITEEAQRAQAVREATECERTELLRRQVIAVEGIALHLADLVELLASGSGALVTLAGKVSASPLAGLIGLGKR